MSAPAAMKMCRRIGSTGTSAPAIAPISRAYGPAALTTARVSIVPREVSTADTRPSATVIPLTSTSRSTVTPNACAVFANPIVTPLGSAMPSRWQKVAASTPSVFSPGASAAASRASSHCTSTPRSRCRATLRLNVSTLAGVESRNR